MTDLGDLYAEYKEMTNETERADTGKCQRGTPCIKDIGVVPEYFYIP